jgi:hypothetical protein
LHNGGTSSYTVHRQKCKPRGQSYGPLGPAKPQQLPETREGSIIHAKDAGNRENRAALTKIFVTHNRLKVSFSGFVLLPKRFEVILVAALQTHLWLTHTMPSLAAVAVDQVVDVLAVASCPEEKNDLGASPVLNVTTGPDNEAPQAEASTDAVATKAARKRRNTVTPNTPTKSSKKKQQSSAGQRTLASFFFSTSSDKVKRARTETMDAKTSLNPVESASRETPLTHKDRKQEASEPKKRRIKTSVTKSVGKSGNCVIGPLDSERSPLEKDNTGKSTGHCDDVNVQNHQSISDNEVPEATKVLLESELNNDGGSSRKRVLSSQVESNVEDLASEVVRHRLTSVFRKGCFPPIDQTRIVVRKR